MKSFFENYKDDIDFVPLQVHSKSDLLKFLDVARTEKFSAVHIVGHGKISKTKCSLGLTMNEKIDLTKEENQKLFKNLGGRIIFFSCCQIGADVNVMQKILKMSDARAIFSYSGDVEDHQAFLIESLFYHLTIGNFTIPENRKWSMHSVYEKLKFALDYLYIDDREEPLRNPLLVADFHDDLS